jgi:hypothetical protein
VNAEAGLFTLLFGGLPLCIGLWQRFRELAPRKWPQIDGTIVNSTIKKQSSRPGTCQYTPIIEYEYSYEDKTYSSSKRRAGNYASGVSADAEAICSRYPVGNQVKVYIDPEDPSNSVLEFGTTPLSWICIILGLFITAAFGIIARMSK